MNTIIHPVSILLDRKELTLEIGPHIPGVYTVKSIRLLHPDEKYLFKGKLLPHNSPGISIVGIRADDVALLQENDDPIILDVCKKLFIEPCSYSNISPLVLMLKTKETPAQLTLLIEAELQQT
jgi:hypothetical protein